MASLLHKVNLNMLALNIRDKSYSSRNQNIRVLQSHKYHSGFNCRTYFKTDHNVRRALTSDLFLHHTGRALTFDWSVNIFVMVVYDIFLVVLRTEITESTVIFPHRQILFVDQSEVNVLPAGRRWGPSLSNLPVVWVSFFRWFLQIDIFSSTPCW